MVEKVTLENLIMKVTPPRAGEDLYRILSMTMRHGLIDQTEKFKKRVASNDTSQYKIISRGQLVVGFPIDEGVLSFQMLHDKAIVSPAYNVWSLKNDIEVFPDYLQKYLKSPEAINYYKQKLRGSTARRRTLPDDIFLVLKIPLPPLEEQKRIAAILDKADAIRRKRQQAIKLADQFLRSVFLDMFGDPVTNPKGWPIERMGDVINFRGGSQPAKTHFINYPKEGYVRLIQIRDFKSDKFTTYIPKKLSKRQFGNDDVMIARYGPPIFQILRGMSGSYNVALMKAEPVEGKIVNDFIFYLLQTPKIHDYVVANSERSAGQSGVNLDLLNNYRLPVPPIAFQENICLKLKKAEEIRKKFIEDNEVSNRLFEALIQQAFNGDLTQSKAAAA